MLGFGTGVRDITGSGPLDFVYPGGVRARESLSGTDTHDAAFNGYLEYDDNAGPSAEQDRGGTSDHPERPSNGGEPNFPIIDREQALPGWVFGGPHRPSIKDQLKEAFPSLDHPHKLLRELQGNPKVRGRPGIEVLTPPFGSPPDAEPVPDTYFNPCLGENDLFGDGLNSDAFWLEPPPREDVADYTSDCFGLPDGPEDVGVWPDHECESPCIVPRECVLPSDEAISAAAETFEPFVLTDATTGIRSSWELLDPAEDISRESEFVSAGAALLQENIDLAEWAVCLAATWHPNVEDHDEVTDCVLEAINGEMFIYLIAEFTGSGATGAATNIIVDEEGGTLENGGEGPIIPIKKSYWQDSLPFFEAGGPEGLCAVAAMAVVLLHEVLHLCGDEDAVDDQRCWGLANMSAISFMWALGQRYPCLQDLECCPKTDEYYFMTSEPNEFLLPDEQEPMPWQPWLC